MTFELFLNQFELLYDKGIINNLSFILSDNPNYPSQLMCIIKKSRVSHNRIEQLGIYLRDNYPFYLALYYNEYSGINIHFNKSKINYISKQNWKVVDDAINARNRGEFIFQYVP